MTHSTRTILRDNAQFETRAKLERCAQDITEKIRTSAKIEQKHIVKWVQLLLSCIPPTRGGW